MTMTTIVTAMRLCSILAIFATGLSAQEFGPARGALVVSGGGGDPGGKIMARFIELAGGPDVPFIVVPTSGDEDSYDESYSGLQSFKRAGAKNVTILHTRDRNIANTDAFVAPLKKARGVWFAGGSHWRHADAYLDTKVHQELFKLLDRGGVIGGGSAGGHIQSDWMNVSRRPELEFSERTLPKDQWRRGFRLVKNVIFDVHVLARNRHFDMVGVINAHPTMLGVGMDEGTAVVVQGDKFEVIGSSYVLIYDNQHQLQPDGPETFRTVGGPFYFLKAGDTFDMKTRQAFRPTRTPQPIERVIERKWTNPTS
jgi:cyanophycinase